MVRTTAGDLHLGALLDEAGERGADLHLDSADLTTHGVVVGMTGSGKRRVWVSSCSRRRPAPASPRWSSTPRARIARKRAQVEQAQRRVEAAGTEVQTRRSQEMVSGAGALLGVLLGGRSRTMAGRAARTVGGAASRRGTTTRAAQRREEAAAKVELATEELADLEQQLIDEVADIQAKWDVTATETDTVSLTAAASNVSVTDRALVWVPTAAPS